MINRRIFRTIQELKEYEAFVFHTREYASRTPRPEVSPYGPHYRMHPELTRPAYGYILHRAAPVAVGVGIPAYLVATGVEFIPETAGPMYQSSMTGQPTVGTGGSALLSYQADPDKSILANFLGFFTQ